MSERYRHIQDATILRTAEYWNLEQARRVPQQFESLGQSFRSKEDAFKKISKNIIDDITKTREQFLEARPDADKIDLTYDIELDQGPYVTLQKYNQDTSGAFEKSQESLDRYTHFQLDTMLKERFGALGSKWKMRIEKDGLYSEHGSELIRDMMRRGQEHRENHGSQEVERETAEVDAFEKVTEPLLRNDQTPIGTTVLSPSLPGIKYKKNFYDMFTLCVNEKGERYVEAKRYSSAIHGEDYFPVIQKLNNQFIVPDMKRVPNLATYLLARPFLVSNPLFKTPEDIHTFIHRDHTFTTEEKMVYILKKIGMLKDNYIQGLHLEAWNTDRHKRAFNAILNGSDILAKEYDELSVYIQSSDTVMAAIDYGERVVFDPRMIRKLETQKVIGVATGCGRLEGYDVSEAFENPIDRFLQDPLAQALQAQDPFSVLDFSPLGKSEKEPLKFDCPNCHKVTKGRIGNQCPKCNITLKKWQEIAKKKRITVCA